MAGAGSRFLKAGYHQPKYAIKASGKTLFEWSMSSLANFNQKPNVQYIFVAPANQNVKSFINSKVKSLGIHHFQIIEVDHLTDGQATSALLAKPYWQANDELIIYNIDTYVEPDALKPKDIKGDGFIPCFNAEGDHWSFVKLDQQGRATEVREKDRISNNCTIGLYYFKTCTLYQHLYTEYYTNQQHSEQKEKYIAPLYNQMIKENLNVQITIIPPNKVHVLGTPDEVAIFEKEFSL